MPDENGARITGEMMICNFDARRVIPYSQNTVILPFKEFMKIPFSDGLHHTYNPNFLSFSHSNQGYSL
jgi:hypothetical protein